MGIFCRLAGLSRPPVQLSLSKFINRGANDSGRTSGGRRHGLISGDQEANFSKTSLRASSQAKKDQCSRP